MIFLITNTEVHKVTIYSSSNFFLLCSQRMHSKKVQVFNVEVQ